MTIDQWFPTVEFPLSNELFEQLPRHPGYQYEHDGNNAQLTPLPRQYHCRLTLQHRPVTAMVDAAIARLRIRSLRDDDWPALEPLLDSALRTSTPLGHAPADASAAAAREALLRVRHDEFHPLVTEACFVACGALPAQENGVMGALLVSLIPDGDLEDFDDAAWNQQPPTDAVATRWGVPHLTWVFVDPWVARHGVASALLDDAAHTLIHLGYRELASTFLLGNQAATFWHWKNNFRLCSFVASPRRIVPDPLGNTL